MSVCSVTISKKTPRVKQTEVHAPNGKKLQVPGEEIGYVLKTK